MSRLEITHHNQPAESYSNFQYGGRINGISKKLQRQLKKSDILQDAYEDTFRHEGTGVTTLVYKVGAAWHAGLFGAHPIKWSESEYKWVSHA